MASGARRVTASAGHRIKRCWSWQVLAVATARRSTYSAQRVPMAPIVASQWAPAMTMSLCAVALLATAAAVSSVASGSGSCSTATDCNLNGLCTAGSCACDVPWTGPQCGVFKTEPVPSKPYGYGMQPKLRATWGGNPLYDAATGTYHLYVAEMANNCTLQTWGHNSRCAHAVSKTIEGPYTKVDVAVDVWCHNPQTLNDTARGRLVMFHIGSGTGGSPVTCNTGELLGNTPANYAPLPLVEDPARRIRGAGGGSTIHVATSPNGPWTAFTGAQGFPGCNNPTPAIHPNGTWFVVCSSRSLYSAPALEGPWVQVGSVTHDTAGAVSGSYEDAFLYFDTRANWHVIFHVYNATTPCGECLGTLVSGHAFSTDGLTWIGSAQSPYSNVLQRDDGTSMTVSTRERPKLFFAGEPGRPTHLITGTCIGATTCPPTPGVNCKYQHDDATVVQKLAAS